MNTRFEDVSARITNAFYNQNKKDENIRELKENKQLLQQKYENCKQLNIELYTKLERYRVALRKSQIDSDKKAKAIATYIKNNCEIKHNLCKEKSDLESEIRIMKNTLKDFQSEVEKLKSDIRFEKKEYQELWRKSAEEKNHLRLECQGLIDAFKEENEKLVNSNKELKNRIQVIRQMNDAIEEQRIEKFKHTIDQQNCVKAVLIKTHDLNEKHLKDRLESLTNKYMYLRKQNDLNVSL